jgi:signal transduction histidine kinase
MVARELRGPLTPLWMASQLIRNASAERPEILRLTDMIDRQVNGIARLAQDLMDATRVDRDALLLSKVDIEIATLLADICEVPAAAAAPKNQAFTVSIPDRTWRVKSDPVRLTPAVGNLLHNAVKYTAMHGNIRMTVSAEENNLVIKINDDGWGFRLSCCRIFSSFHTAVSSRSSCRSSNPAALFMAAYKWKERLPSSRRVTLQRRTRR